MRNVATKQSFFIGAFVTERANASAEKHPRLVFGCGGEACWLHESWTGDAGTYLKVVRRGASSIDGLVRFAVVSSDAKAGD